MSYFNKFPFIQYELDDTKHIVKDILRRTYFLSEYKKYSDLFYTYIVKNGETPSSIAYEQYSSADLHWTILQFNEIHDVYTEWVMDEPTLEAYCLQKYPGTFNSGIPNMNKVYYYLKNGAIVGEFNSTPIDDLSNWVSPSNTDNTATAVTFYDHEAGENELRRNIRLLRPELISDFVSQFEEPIIK